MNSLNSNVLFLAVSIAACGGKEEEREPTGCPTELEEVECTHPLEVDTVLDRQVMVCTGDLSIRAALVLRNGSELRSSGRFFVEQGGSIRTEGTEDCKIRITSAQDTPAPGDWSSMWIKDDADNSSLFQHTIIEYGGAPNGMIDLAGGGSVGFDHVTVQHASEVALDLNDGTVTQFSAVEFSDIPGVALRIHPDFAEVVEPDIAIDAATVQEPFVDVVGNPMSVDGTWEALPVPYRLFGDIAFEARLTVTEGADLAIAPAQRFFVQNGGSVQTLGTEANPVTIRSANATGAAEDWRDITIQPTAANDTTFRHTTISHGGEGGVGVITVQTGAALALDHATFSDNGVCDIRENGAVDETESTWTACP